MSEMLFRPASGAARRERLLVPLLLVASLAALSVSSRVHSEPINNLEQIAIAVHDGTNNLSQIAIGLHDFSYAAGDGSVRMVSGDGSVRLISVGPDVHAALCFHGVTVGGSIQDGTSNTILFSETVGLQFQGGVLSSLSTVRSVLDGSSNTITFPELPLTQFCIGGVTGLDPVTGPNLTDGLSNSITFGEGSSFDLCLSTARTPTIVDGTSNTILFPETRSNFCLDNIVPAGDLTVTASVSEPATVALLVPLGAILFASRRRGARDREVALT